MSKLIQLVHNNEGDLVYALDDEGQIYSWDQTNVGFGVTRYSFVPCKNNMAQWSEPLEWLGKQIASSSNAPHCASLVDAITARLSHTKHEVLTDVPGSLRWNLICKATQLVAIFTIGEEIPKDEADLAIKGEVAKYEAYLGIGVRIAKLTVLHRKDDNVIWVKYHG